MIDCSMIASMTISAFDGRRRSIRCGRWPRRTGWSSSGSATKASTATRRRPGLAVPHGLVARAGKALLRQRIRRESARRNCEWNGARNGLAMECRREGGKARCGAGGISSQFRGNPLHTDCDSARRKHMAQVSSWFHCTGSAVASAGLSPCTTSSFTHTHKNSSVGPNKDLKVPSARTKTSGHPKGPSKDRFSKGSPKVGSDPKGSP